MLELLHGRTPDGWADLKAADIASQVPLRTVTRGAVTVEISGARSAKAGRRRGLEVLIRAWDAAGPVGFGADGTVEIERCRIINPPILVPDPLGVVTRTEPDADGVPVTRRYRDDPVAALWETVFHTVRVAGTDGRRIVPGKVGHTVTTVFPVAGTGTAPVDAVVNRSSVDETLTTIRSGAGVFASATVANPILRIDASTTTDQFKTLSRCFYGFDTSFIGSDTVSSAVLTLNSAANQTGLGNGEVAIVAMTPASESAAGTGDYAIAGWGTTEFATRIGSASWSAAGYNDFTLNASGLAHLETAANTFFGARVGWDLDNSFGGTWASNATTNFSIYQADQAGTTNDPKLVVTHAAAATGRPNYLSLLGVR